MCLGKKVIVYSESYDTYIYQKKVQKDPIKKKAKIVFFNIPNMANISISVTPRSFSQGELTTQIH